MFTENVNVIYSYMCNYSFIHTHIIVSIVNICTSIKHEYIQLYLYLNFGILTFIRVIIKSHRICDMYNYMSNYTGVYLQLYEYKLYISNFKESLIHNYTQKRLCMNKRYMFLKRFCLRCCFYIRFFTFITNTIFSLISLFRSINTKIIIIFFP